MNVIEQIASNTKPIGQDTKISHFSISQDDLRKLYSLAKIGQELIQMHKNCSDCSTAGICANLADCFNESDDICQGCDCFEICKLLVEYYAFAMLLPEPPREGE